MILIPNPIKKGFTLLEAMIALVIFSIGLLGLAGLQSAGMRNNQISYSRTVATQLAYDMADRIRNNAPTEDYSGTYDGSIAAAGQNCITAAAGCNAAQMTAFDQDEWDKTITAPTSPLKNAVGFIALNNGTYTISVGWDEGLTGNAPANCNAPLPQGIMCVTIQVMP